MKTVKFLPTFLAVIVGLIPAIALFFVLGHRMFFPEIHIVPETLALENPSDPFVVSFSEPVKRESYEGRISVDPSMPVLVGWNDDNTRLSIKPAEKWREGSRYRVFLDTGRADFGRAVDIASFSFDVPGYPEIVSMIPKDGSADVLLGIEDPMVVRFDRSVRDFFVDFRLSPALPVVYENDVEKTEFKLLPSEPIRAGTSYELAVYVKWRGESESAYVRVGSTRFTTLPEKPKEWSRDLVVRIEEAKRFARPRFVTGKYIDIDIAAQVMTIFEDGRLLDAYLVSSGLRGMDTPKGEYRIHNKADKPWSKKYELYMPNWMAITPDGKYGIHELPEWPGGYKEGANHLGIPVSHGCVRLGVGPAKRVFDWAEIGTPVVVH